MVEKVVAVFVVEFGGVEGGGGGVEEECEGGVF
jgi:hypothetical protein